MDSPKSETGQILMGEFSSSFNANDLTSSDQGQCVTEAVQVFLRPPLHIWRQFNVSFGPVHIFTRSMDAICISIDDVSH